MGGVLCRAVEIVNETGAVLIIKEVVESEDRKEICKLGPGESIYLKGWQFMNRSIGTSLNRTIRVTAGYNKAKTLEANYFRKHGKVTFRLVDKKPEADKKLEAYPEEIPHLRRLRLVARIGTTFVSNGKFE